MALVKYSKSDSVEVSAFNPSGRLKLPAEVTAQ
jgi:hypothetical protein